MNIAFMRLKWHFYVTELIRKALVVKFWWMDFWTGKSNEIIIIVKYKISLRCYIIFIGTKSCEGKWKKYPSPWISIPMNIHLNEYFLKSAWGWSGLASDISLWKTSSPNKEMQALSECVKASQDPRCRSNRPWTSQVWRPATGAGWKHPTWCSPTQTRRTGSRLPRAEAAAATTTTSTTTMRNPGIMRRPKSLHLTIFVNEIKTSIQKPFSFREAKKRLPLQIH